MLHTLEDFCAFLYPALAPGSAAFLRQYYWLHRLGREGARRGCYHTLELPKGGGGVRRILAPSPALKFVQRSLLPLLSGGPVAGCATAYRPGGSALANAAPHAGRPLLVRLDLRDFFGCIGFRQVFAAIDGALRLSPLVGGHYLNAYDRAAPDPAHFNRVLGFYFARYCTLGGALVQGAPTSPLLSNLVFYPLDARIGAYCKKRGIVYTRYSDDMAFSGEFGPRPLIQYVGRLLGQNGFSLNEGKTAVLGPGRRHQITGVVVNARPQAGREYRRRLRQALYYIDRHGVRGHLRHTTGREPGEEEVLRCLRRLAGQVAFVLYLRPDDDAFLAARRQCAALLAQELENGGAPSNTPEPAGGRRRETGPSAGGVDG